MKVEVRPKVMRIILYAPHKGCEESWDEVIARLSQVIDQTILSWVWAYGSVSTLQNCTLHFHAHHRWKLREIGENKRWWGGGQLMPYISIFFIYGQINHWLKLWIRRNKSHPHTHNRDQIQIHAHCGILASTIKLMHCTSDFPCVVSRRLEHL